MAIIKLNNRGVKDATAFGSVSSLGSLSFLSKQTASSDATISFTSGIDSTYKEYIFYFKNLHNSDDDNQFSFNFSTDGGSNYNVSKTSSFFYAINTESSSNAFAYYVGGDLANGTGFQITTIESGADNDECDSGYLQLLNPSSPTFVKHFMCTMSETGATPRTSNNYIAGYGNTTSAINAVQFKYASGNIDSGDILLFGLN